MNRGPGAAGETESWVLHRELKIMAENVGATRDGNPVLRIPGFSVLKLKALNFKSYLGLDQGEQDPSGVAAYGRVFKFPTAEKPRACVAVKGIDARLIPHLCSRDVVAVELDVNASGSRRKVVVCSAYFLHVEGGPPPAGPVTRLVEYCQNERLLLIVGCDANSHRTVWGSMYTNDRGRKLLEFIASTDLEILNRGNESTFCTALRREVLDLIVYSRQIIFGMAWARGEVSKFRNPKKTDRDSYRNDLKCYLQGFPRRHGTKEELELCVDHLQRAQVESYKKNCPERAVKNSRGNSWWSPKLQELRSVARRA
ncbi:uncharacterized protein LOC105196947 [Solenopsis invicta]|uniref:uncharacterized protein LOC105196947 n=1 Tax=Solenopsis invicta TaxID=13686 RepID=UPI00193E6A37|nr:uncharacterized protein LOC105196947 [Solenopsis invicta]